MAGTPSNDLNIQTAGYCVFDGVSNFSGRTFQAGTGITLTNASGVAGNTTITANGANDLHTALYIVSSSGTTGTGANYTTITSAIAAAQGSGINSTIFIMPGNTGTYTENFTLPANINLVGHNGDQTTPNVTIIGTITCTSAGTRSISNLRLQTNSAAFLAVTGTLATVVNLNNCYLNCSNNTGITFSTNSASAVINIIDCLGDIGTTGISYFTHTSAGTIAIYYSILGNSGSSTTSSTASSGNVFLLNSTLSFPVTTSSTAGISIQNTSVSTAAQNTTALTVGGSGINGAMTSSFLSGSASAISVGGTLTVTSLTVNSTNTNAITGAGTLVGNSINFTGSSSLVNTTTLTALSFGLSGPWTPDIQINSSSTGITYTTQSGGYVQIGNVVNLWATVTLSSKGASVGNVTISNLPVALTANGVLKTFPIGEYNQVTASGYTQLGVRPGNTGTVGSFIISSGSGSGVANLANTHISDTFQFRFSASYIVN